MGIESRPLDSSSHLCLPQLSFDQVWQVAASKVFPSTQLDLGFLGLFSLITYVVQACLCAKPNVEY